MSESPVLLTQRGAAAILTIDRPDRMNALSRDTLLALGQFGRDAIADPAVRAIVLTGSGDKAFCAGADLKERHGMDENDVRAQLLRYREELRPLDHSPKPVVAAINGLALGGGLELALMCDLRVAAATAVLGLPETTLGIIPGAGGTQRLPRIVGEARAKEMILLGRRVDAEQALAWGLVNRVSPANTAVLEDTLAFIEPITSGAPIAQSAALAAIDVSFDVSLAHGLELERAYYDACLRSDDRRLALEAFAQKKRPVFTGK
ncbi:MAG TPA: enoyl-CoA hydratase-related protein [Polyangiaceae bacterium]